MKKIISIVTVISAILVTIFFVSGCLGQKIAEQAVEKVIEKAIGSEDGEEIDIDLDEEGMTIKTDEAEMTIGTSADLPDGFPNSVPVYPDMEITTSWKTVNDGKENFSIGATTKDSGEKVFNWYKDKLSGWDIESEWSADSGDDGKTSILDVSDGNHYVSITVVETPGEGTAVILNVVEK